MRLIDADYILSALNVFYDRKHGNEHFLLGIETAQDIVKGVPTIDPKPQWIPVTERLPDENQPVCILLENGNVFRAEIRTRQLLKEWWYRYDPTDEDMDMLGIHYEVEGWLKENPIVAWMPLSEPYTSAGEETEYGTTE